MKPRTSLTIFAACALAALLAGCGPKKTSTDAEQAIENNLRQFHLGGQQCILETGRAEARYADVVGDKKFLPRLEPVNGEDYTGLTVTSSTQSLSVTAADGTTVTYTAR